MIHKSLSLRDLKDVSGYLQIKEIKEKSSRTRIVKQKNVKVVTILRLYELAARWRCDRGSRSCCSWHEL